MNEAWTRRRQAAKKYQPARIRLLLVAEAPPSEDEYFYFEDVKTVDDLFEEVCAIIFEAAPERNKVPYLKELRRRGLFLIEVKPDAPRHDEALGPYVAPLLLNIETLAPEKIIVVKADVYDVVYSKMKQAGLPIVDVRIPFPAMNHQPEFRQKFRQALVRAGLEKLIRPLPHPSTEPAHEKEAPAGAPPERGTKSRTRSRRGDHD